MRHTITILVENEFGVLTRIAGLFSARGYNIESLSVAPTMDETVSRLTLVTRGDEKIIEQIKKQLNKLIPVIKTEDISFLVHLEREMLMVKALDKDGNMAIAEDAGVKIIDHEMGEYLIAELIATNAEIDDLLEKLGAENIVEITRTGPVGMRRGLEGFVV